MPANFQIPEFIQGYIGSIGIELLQAIIVLLIFVMVAIALKRMRNISDEVAALQGSIRELFVIEQRRSLTAARARRGTAPDGGIDVNAAETAVKIAEMKIEIEALKGMFIDLRQASDDRKAQAGRVPLAPVTPSSLSTIPTAAPEPGPGNP